MQLFRPASIRSLATPDLSSVMSALRVHIPPARLPQSKHSVLQTLQKKSQKTNDSNQQGHILCENIVSTSHTCELSQLRSECKHMK